MPKTKALRTTPRRKSPSPRPRGFAVMSPRERSRIAALGGRAIAARPGHMSLIGAKGGASKATSKAKGAA